GQIRYLGDASLTTAYLAGIAFCAWAGYRTNPESKRVTAAIAQAILCAAVISTGIGLYQWFGLQGLTIWAVEGVPGARAGGNLAQPNQLATLLLEGIAV